jgi:purine-binding chemotaxis protein CheW
MTDFQHINGQLGHGAAPSAASRELIAFRIGDQEFCVDIMSIREIRGWTKTTTLPRSPAYVRGVVNLRGAVLPIIDLSSRLGFADSEPTDRSVIIVAQIEAQLVGLLVDAVSEIITVTSTDIQPTPDVASDLVKTFVQGILAIEGRMISLISLDHVLPQMQLELA